MDSATGKVTAYKDPKLPAAKTLPAGAGWVTGLDFLTLSDAQTLLAVVQTLYPHDGISPEVYRRTVARMDGLAADAPTAGKMFRTFCDMLAALWPLPFAELAETYRTQALKKLQTTPQFFFVQRMAVRYLYDDVELWAAFGYEGASVHLGGYAKRGFDDLDWLPPLPNDI